MFNRWAAAAVVVLALCAVTPENAEAQVRSTAGGALRANVPNPFNPETRIPFDVGDEKCSDASRQYDITIRIYSILSTPIAVPRLQEVVSGGGSTGPIGQRIQNLKLRCGSYEAYWDGKDQHTGREVASGIYGADLIVDGRLVGTLKMMVTK